MFKSVFQQKQGNQQNSISVLTKARQSTEQWFVFGLKIAIKYFY